MVAICITYYCPESYKGLHYLSHLSIQDDKHKSFALYMQFLIILNVFIIIVTLYILLSGIEVH